MDRRTFVSAGAAAFAGLALPEFLKAQTCGTPTTADRYGYGPYYLEGAPQRARLGNADEPGTPLSIAGTVSNCGGPVKGASLEVWQATDKGCYIHPSQPACQDRGNPQVSRLWALLISDAQGRFAFDTIRPGVYLNGDRYRPSHIHFRIRSPQGAATAVDVVTQLYFQGDQYIPGDFGADEPGAKARTIALSRPSAQAPFQGTFNVTLPGGTTGIGRARDPLSDPALGAFDALVQRHGDRFRIFLPPLAAGLPVEVRVYDGAGTLMQRGLQAGSPVELNASLWARGGYLAEMRWRTARGWRTESVSLRK
jgi:protocatechuate 3,4-dioxygenase beta subunit